MTISITDTRNRLRDSASDLYSKSAQLHRRTTKRDLEIAAAEMSQMAQQLTTWLTRPDLREPEGSNQIVGVGAPEEK